MKSASTSVWNNTANHSPELYNSKYLLSLFLWLRMRPHYLSWCSLGSNMETFNHRINTRFESWLGPRGESLSSVSFQSSVPPLQTVAANAAWVARKTRLTTFSICVQMSGCEACCCWTTTHPPLRWRSSISWSCGWGPSTWSTDSRTPAEVPWCSTTWASRCCPSTCSTRWTQISAPGDVAALKRIKTTFAFRLQANLVRIRSLVQMSFF